MVATVTVVGTWEEVGRTTEDGGEERKKRNVEADGTRATFCPTVFLLVKKTLMSAT